MVKNPPADAVDAGSIPGSGRSPGGRNANPLQYSCLENPMDRGTWWAPVRGRYDLNQIPYDYTVKVRNRFKGLDLIDRVPDELWMEAHDIV